MCDPEGSFARRANPDSIVWQRLASMHWESVVLELVREHVVRTDSEWAKGLLEDWDRVAGHFWQVVPKEMLAAWHIRWSRRRWRRWSKVLYERRFVGLCLACLLAGERPMRAFPILAFSAALLASPALAQPPRPERPSAADAARMLQNPVAQDAAARALTQLAGIVLDTRVGPLAALDPDADVRPGDSLRDLKRRDDPHYEQHLYRDTKRALGQAGAVAGGVAAESDELRRTAARLRDALAPLMGALAPAEDSRAGDY